MLPQHKKRIFQCKSVLVKLLPFGSEKESILILRLTRARNDCVTSACDSRTVVQTQSHFLQHGGYSLSVYQSSGIKMDLTFAHWFVKSRHGTHFIYGRLLWTLKRLLQIWRSRCDMGQCLSDTSQWNVQHFHCQDVSTLHNTLRIWNVRPSFPCSPRYGFQTEPNWRRNCYNTFHPTHEKSISKSIALESARYECKSCRVCFSFNFSFNISQNRSNSCIFDWISSSTFGFVKSKSNPNLFCITSIKRNGR